MRKSRRRWLAYMWRNRAPTGTLNMSSSEFETTLNNGCEWVLVHYGSDENVRSVLNAIREKSRRPESDPLRDRLLFVDPSLLAQQLGVPFETVEELVRFLHRMNILQLWLRLSCPNPPEATDNIILEPCDPI